MALWVGETASFAAKTKELERMQHGPYIVWDKRRKMNGLR